MRDQHSTAGLLAGSLLGVVAVAAFVAGIIFLFGAWVVGEGSAGFALNVGAAGALLLGLLTLGFSVLAAIAARQEWLERPLGRLLGMVVGIVVVLAAVTGLLVGGVSDSAALLWIAAALGVATLAPLLLQDVAVADGRKV